jgi:hypothetical protein
MEDFMSETAVGLFKNTSTAESAADALRAHGIPANAIRTVTQPLSLPVGSATSTPGVDFAAALARELRSMGASESESRTYLDGINAGNTIIFVTGSREQAESAISIMNQFDALEIEEYAGAGAGTPMASYGENPGPSMRSKIDDERKRSDGARLFTW